jgi:hypothetical protein
VLGYRDGRDNPRIKSGDGHDDASGKSTDKDDNYSTGLHSTGISRYPLVVFSTWATDGNG